MNEVSSSLPSKYTWKDPLIKILLGFRSYSFNWWIWDGYHLIDDSLRSNIWRHISLTKKFIREWPNISIFPKQLWMIYFEFILKASPVGPRIKVSFLDYSASILGQIQSSSPLFISSSSLSSWYSAFLPPWNWSSSETLKIRKWKMI